MSSTLRRFKALRFIIASLPNEFAFTGDRLIVAAIYSRTKLHHRDVIDAFRFSKMSSQCSTWFRGRRFRCKLKNMAKIYSRTISSILFHKNVIRNEATVIQPRGISQTYFSLLCVARSWPLRSSSQVDAEWLRESLNHRRSNMKKFLTSLAVLTAFATPAFAQSFDPDNGTGNMLSFSYKSTAPQNDKIAIGRSGLHSFAMVPTPGSAFNPDSPAATGGAASATMNCSVPTERMKKTGRALARPLFHAAGKLAACLIDDHC